MEYVYLLLLLGVVVALCIFINRVTDKLKIPSLLLFIGLGMVFGVLLRPQIGNFTDYNFGNVVCSVCLVFVIFYGGFGTNFKEAKPVAPQALLLSFAGTALTAGIVGVFVYYVFQLLPFFGGGIGWAESMLIGSVICSTDAASVFNILRSRRLNLKYGTSSMLEMESGSNDPMSYMLTVVFTAVIAAQYGISGSASMSAGEIAGMLFSQVGFGAIFGVGFGFAGIFLLRRFSGDGGQRGAIFIFALALITYALPTLLGEITGVSWLAGNGYLGVYICGIMLGNARIPQKKDCVRFFDALTGVGQMIIFFLLGFLATPEWLIRPEVLIPALLVFLFMTVVARPVTVGGLLAPFRAKWNQIGVVSWAGLRGVASIVFHPGAGYAVASHVQKDAHARRKRRRPPHLQRLHGGERRQLRQGRRGGKPPLGGQKTQTVRHAARVSGRFIAARGGGHRPPTCSLPPRPSLKTAKISACSRSLSAKITRGRAKRCASWSLRPARSSP